MTPDQHTNQELMLDVGEGHQLYVQDWGRADAKYPIIFLHGGPGNGVANRDRRKFDPSKQRVIFFDQRGSGNSLPLGSLEHNTTQDLVEDIEKIALKLELDKFVLTGGSWGSFLAFAYGIAYPERVQAIVVNGIFTGSSDDIAWIDKGGFKDFFPDVWEHYLESVPPEHRDNPSKYHASRALGVNAEEAKQSAHAYESMELALLKLDDRFSPPEYETYDPRTIQTELHYLANKCFVADDYIINNAAKLAMPVWLVQGRYDMVCRPSTAYRLHQNLPNSHLVWTINGHLSQHESSNIQQLLLLQIAGGE